MVVIGPGAIGLSAAAAAHRGGVRVRVAGRRGGDVPTVRWAGDRIDVPGPVLTDPETVQPPDWLVLAVKTYQTPDAAAWLRALTGDHTRIVVLQNGVEQVAEVAPYAPSATILPAIVWWPAERDAHGEVQVRAPQLWLTMPAGADSDDFADMMEPAELHVNRADDMLTELWRKLLLNAVSGLMVLAVRRAGMFAGKHRDRPDPRIPNGSRHVHAHRPPRRRSDGVGGPQRGHCQSRSGARHPDSGPRCRGATPAGRLRPTCGRL